MRIRTTSVAVLAALAVTLVGCSSSGDDSSVSTKPTKASTPKATKTMDGSDAEEAVAIPPEPNGVKRVALLTALKVVNPVLVVDEDKAVDNARNQCSTINGGGDAGQSAKSRFSTSDHEVSDAEAKEITTHS
ncbi:hypothetical protein ABZ341_13595 [Streptomyces sp. NPDC006173]|uniref:hypothetical protein n=1 Tax=Streptomyces sp. NPDC006173 TaxID=3155349 RepID=UPI003406BC11